MSTDAQAILANLNAVDHERQKRTRQTGLSARVSAIKRFQHARFERGYADLLSDRRYARAARFFLDDLYGPHDFTDRDAQFARVVPALVRLFPSSVVHTVRTLSVLHALSESLDSAMGVALPAERVDAVGYATAWRTVGRAADRERQIVLMHEIGQALDRFTRNAFLRHSLRMMRAPAKASGLSSLQVFLESGFDAFHSMQGAREFLETVARRERRWAAALDQTELPVRHQTLPADFPWPDPVPV